MTRLIIQHLWSDFKKHWLGILLILGLCYIGTAFALTFGLWFFMIDSQAYLLSDAELKEIILNGSEVYTLLYFIYTAGILLSVILISRKFPVRLLKPILFLPCRSKNKTERFAFLPGKQICDLPGFISITLPGLYRKSDDIFSDS